MSMKKILIVIIILAWCGDAFSLKTDSVCRIPIMVFEDTSIFNIIDTLMILEQTKGEGVTDRDNISIYFIDTGGYYCMVRFENDSLLGKTILSSSKEHVKIAFYKGMDVLITGNTPYRGIMSNSGEYKTVECVSFSDQDIVYEDHPDGEVEHEFSLIAKWEKDHMQIYMISNRYGEIIYDSSIDSHFSLDYLEH